MIIGPLYVYTSSVITPLPLDLALHRLLVLPPNTKLYLGVTHQYNYHHKTCSRTRTSATGDEAWSSVSGGPSKNKGDLWSNTRHNNISVELLCQSPLGVLFGQGLLLFRGDHDLLVIHTTSKAKRDSSSGIPSGLLAITFTLLAITFGVNQLANGFKGYNLYPELNDWDLALNQRLSISLTSLIGSGAKMRSFLYQTPLAAKLNKNISIEANFWLWLIWQTAPIIVTQALGNITKKVW
jgi:hypothetical protein